MSGQYKTIPAADGWRVLSPCYDNRRIVGVVAEPVLAWLVEVDPIPAPNGEPYAFVRAVTIDGIPNSFPEGICAVRRPDGSVTIPQMADFADEAELIHYWNDREAGR